MAVVEKQSSVLLIEFLDSFGDTALNWRLDNYNSEVSRSDILSSLETAFSDTNVSGINLLRASGGQVAVSVGKTQTIETMVRTTDLG